MLKAIIFDMDGVIIDSEPLHARAVTMALKKYNIEVPLEYNDNFIGSTTYCLFQKMIEDYKIGATPDELLSAYNEAEAYLSDKEGYPLVPYVNELIKDLHKHGLKLIIASSSPADAIESVLQAFQLKEYFNGYVSGTSIEHSKPAPDIFLLAAEKLAVAPDECIVIEDSANGIAASVAAGITCIGFVNPNSGKQDLGKADMLVEGFDEVDFDFVSNVYRHSHMEAAVILTTQRLVIKELSVDDIDALLQICSEPQTRKFTDDISDSVEIEKDKQKAYIKYIYQYYGYGLWGVFLKESRKLIGRCGIELKMIDGASAFELGYLIGRAYQRKGYASECVKAVTAYFFKNYDVPQITAVIDKNNIPSIQFAESLGMKRAGETIRGRRNCFKYIIENPKSNLPS